MNQVNAKTELCIGCGAEIEIKANGEPYGSLVCSIDCYIKACGLEAEER